MMENNRANYREKVNNLGKKEFTLMKMQEYGFWPKNLKTPYERQENEAEEDFELRKKLTKKYTELIDRINNLYTEKNDINEKLNELRKQYDETFDYEKMRKYIAKDLMEESIKRREERKLQREKEKQEKTENWNKKKSENVLFIGRGYSSMLNDKETCLEALNKYELPIIDDDKKLSEFLGLEYKKFRYLVYHRDVVTFDNYVRYTIPKKSGGVRKIAAPKKNLKCAQRIILDQILCKIPTNDCAHGFISERSVVSGAMAHKSSPELLINIDLKDFFGTITFSRVRGMFKSLGYSGYVASLMAMICTYVEREPIEIKGETRYVKVSDRVLPQGAPSSPMITNIVCAKLDKRISGLASKYGFEYSRYADDMSFSFKSISDTLDKFNGGLDSSKAVDDKKIVSVIIGITLKVIREEGFNVNNKKTRYLRNNNCQSITGIVINNQNIGVPKKWVKNFRAAIYNANKEKQLKGSLSQGEISKIKGMACWLKNVNEERYKKIIDQALKIIE